jgi:hypothetical protein
MVNVNTVRDISILDSLTEEELSKVPSISEEMIKQALERGRKDRDAAEANARPLPNHSRVLFH